MAYQDVSSPAAQLSHEIAATRHFFERIGTFLSRLNFVLMTNSAASARLQKVQELQAKSDEELAALKIKRDEIVPHVFRDLYYV